jgi:AcrR family transcriptional regulator
MSGNPGADSGGAAGQPGLTRARLVAAALELVSEGGTDGLTMRGLADRLDVRAASLYWHVRDRGELLDLVAEAVLAAVPSVDPRRGWRDAVGDLCAAIGGIAASRRDAARIVLAVPGAIERSAVHASLAGLLVSAGLDAGTARSTATMMVAHALLGPARGDLPPAAEPGRPNWVAVDSGSRGVTLRAGGAMDTLFRVASDPARAAPAVIQGETVLVRRLRGVGTAEIELNPATPWHFKVHGATHNTRLDLSGIDVREIHLDSGAAKIDCVLPPPRGRVPIRISGGIVGCALHRPPGVRVVADIRGGAVKLRLDAFSTKVALFDARWESAPGSDSGDHYALEISGGAVQVSLDEDAPHVSAPDPAVAAAPNVDPAVALDVLLDGVEARVHGRGRGGNGSLRG